MTRWNGVAACMAAVRFGVQPGRQQSKTGIAAIALATAAVSALAGCTTDQTVTGSVNPADAKKTAAATTVDDSQRQCLMRAMYFESNRSSSDGMLAVGSVVMNRVKSPEFPDTICGVVGQPHQFAPGVMSRKMTSNALPTVEAVADEVIGGERHPKVGPAMFFHTAGLHFPYHNMHYVVVAGGNAFYEKTGRYSAPSMVADASVPVPDGRPADGLPGVTVDGGDALPKAASAYAAQSTVEARINEAFASVTN